MEVPRYLILTQLRQYIVILNKYITKATRKQNFLGNFLRLGNNIPTKLKTISLVDDSKNSLKRKTDSLLIYE